MYEHVKTGCKHIPPSEQPLQFQSGYFLNKPLMCICCIPCREVGRRESTYLPARDTSGCICSVGCSKSRK